MMPRVQPPKRSNECLLIKFHLPHGGVILCSPGSLFCNPARQLTMLHQWASGTFLLAECLRLLLLLLFGKKQAVAESCSLINCLAKRTPGTLQLVYVKKRSCSTHKSSCQQYTYVFSYKTSEFIYLNSSPRWETGKCFFLCERENEFTISTSACAHKYNQ